MEHDIKDVEDLCKKALKQIYEWSDSDLEISVVRKSSGENTAAVELRVNHPVVFLEDLDGNIYPQIESISILGSDLKFVFLMNDKEVSELKEKVVSDD